VTARSAVSVKLSLPSERPTVDLHRVAKWSKPATSWKGVSLGTLLADVETAADFALVHSYGGYTTKLPLEVLLDRQAWLAYKYDADGLLLAAIGTTCVGACVAFLAYFYGDHVGRVCFVLNRARAGVGPA
jgi:hypothetical protein